MTSGKSFGILVEARGEGAPGSPETPRSHGIAGIGKSKTLNHKRSHSTPLASSSGGAQEDWRTRGKPSEVYAKQGWLGMHPSEVHANLGWIGEGEGEGGSRSPESPR